MFNIEPYRHFKNDPYLRICEMTIKGCSEPLVLYRCLKEDRLYCRPKANFHGSIETRIYSGPRFTKIDGFETEIVREHKRLAQATVLDILHSETRQIYKVNIDPFRGTAVGFPMSEAHPVPVPSLA